MRTVLSMLARHARWALPAGVLVGIVLPDLAALLHPVITPSVIGTLALTLLRLDWNRISSIARRPALVVLLTVLQLILSPALAWFAASALGLPAPLALALILQSAAPPIASAAVFSLLLGLDGALAAFAAVAATLLLPLTLTVLAAVMIATSSLASALQIDVATFFLRVTLVVATPFLLAGALRAWLGAARLARNDDLLAGGSVVLLVVFAIGVMNGVTDRLLSDPGSIGILFATACVAAVALHALGYLAFAWAGTAVAFNAAVLSGNRNMGLLLAITAGSAGEAFSLYVGIAQIPMYFAPLALWPLVRRGSRTR